MRHRLYTAATVSLLLAGCAVDETTGERTLKSAAAGAAGGAPAGLFFGDPLESAAAGGFVYDQIAR